MIDIKHKCELCGFDKGVAKHHIIKRRLFGSDDPENLIYLCPNHHWVADFGNEDEKNKIIKLIKEMTGKSGKEISSNKKRLIDMKIRVLEENTISSSLFNENFIPITDNEWEVKKQSWNYEFWYKVLSGYNNNHDQSVYNQKAELLLLIKKLKEVYDKLNK